jgi:AcrR family transcriptional regulator
MGIVERKERDRLQLRERILDTALQIVTSDGAAALTMRAIADHIEYSATALYAHFADKDALLQALCMREFGKLSTEMQSFQPKKKKEDALDNLREVGRRYCRFAIDHPQAYRLMFVLEGTPTRSPEADNDPHDAYNICLHFVSQARKANLLRRDLDDDHLIAQVLWSGLHGVLSLHLVKGEQGIHWRDVWLRVETMLDITLAGITRPKRARSSAE